MSIFDEAYGGVSNWEIGRAQREFVALEEAGEIAGDVLDVGCGTGENALILAGRGHEVWGWARRRGRSRSPGRRRGSPTSPSRSWCRTPSRWTQLMEYFNKQPRIGTISTTSKDGKVDVAVMGSPRMTDETTVVIGLATNRTLAKLRENPNAVFIIIKPAAAIMDWKGIRVYMRLTGLASAGPALDAYLAQMMKVAGEAVASMIKALTTFEVTEIRPLLDMGQGWERSI